MRYLYTALLIYLVVAESPIPVNEQQPASPEQQQMQQLLNWAIKHSDQDKLREMAASGRNIKEELGEDVWNELFKQESNEMTKIMSHLNNYTNVDDTNLMISLTRLEDMVVQVDNAMNLHNMGGLEPLLLLAFDSAKHRDLRIQSFLTLGTACQNNPPVQEDIITLGAMDAIMESLKFPAPHGCKPVGDDDDFELCTRLTYFASALVRNAPSVQKVADEKGFFQWCMQILRDHHKSMAVLKRCITVLSTVAPQNSDVSWPSELRQEVPEIAKSLFETFGDDFGITEATLDLVTDMQPFDVDVRPVITEVMARCQSVHGEPLCVTLQEAYKRFEAKVPKLEL